MYVEQARGQALRPLSRLLLWAHLLRCGNCQRYARQSQLIEELARRPLPVVEMPPGLQVRLRQLLHNAGW